MTLGYLGSEDQQSGYGRARYQDFTTTLGGPAVRERLWFFGGYQWLRDYDSQPGTDPELPREVRDAEVLREAHLAAGAGMAAGAELPRRDLASTPSGPRIVTPFEATARPHISAPAMTFGNLTHTMSANTLWDVRVGRFVSARRQRAEHRRSDDAEPVRPRDRRHHRCAAAFGALSSSGQLQKRCSPITGRALGAEHQWKIGGQFERGEHHASTCHPHRRRYKDSGGVPLQRVSSVLEHRRRVPHIVGVRDDTMTMGDRLTITAGLRFDHSRAISQDLPARRSAWE